jgi:preprotein translocase subunit SecG
MLSRLAKRIVPMALAFALLLSQSAFAENDGRGFYGATNDKVVTNAGFILIAFFPIFVFVMSMIQRHLEHRKDARRAGEKAVMHDARWHGGW